MSHFTADALQFLRELKDNNNRAWFEENRARFARSLRDPFARFVLDLAPRLQKVSPYFVVDTKSIARLHKDMRFAGKPSTETLGAGAAPVAPFKTVQAAYFAHDGARGCEAGLGRAPCYFVALEPGAVRVGFGIRTPTAATAKALRVAAKASAAAFEAAASVGVRDRYVVTIALEDAAVERATLLDDVVRACARLAPFAGLVCEALGYPFAGVDLEALEAIQREALEEISRAARGGGAAPDPSRSPSNPAAAAAAPECS